MKTEDKINFAYQKIEVIEDFIKSIFADKKIDKQPAREVLRLLGEAKEILL